ncbi:hypothetical protein CO180_04265 [candidate division WWE3 bacterium CG_4_9_14_3_um_filter_41_6]|uniref:ABC3 transporter permease protein domain-containing protein n=1 Tax=candidate division WWE3 bacterium CG_4_10_14_0_2_um_filter_41_14 TaxID=1975072 RepID=A0A2M7THP7_UNCKA|nr:MAG: hypothetical protein COY32_04645 [candidate division WWE3 bacterium CG_4_10_14_0_2_um_filter_41_14]PJA38123.1 MAG: hypothetical protein CO180_04265 [candidate division WWE3 bacterium CG_4_9_14_3_um_filter_41_6]
MKTIDIIKRGVKNLRRNKSRTLLTVSAIGIGALTLVLTLGVGNALQNYINTNVQLSSSVVSVSKVIQSSSPDDQKDIVSEYSPTKIDSTVVQLRGSISEVEPSTLDDVEAIASVDGVETVWPDYDITPEYVRLSDQDTKYTLSVINVYSYSESSVVAGVFPSDWALSDIVVDQIFAKTFGVNELDLVGKEIVIGIKDANGDINETPFTIVGVREVVRFGPPQQTAQGGVFIGIDAAAKLHEIQTQGTENEGKFTTILAKVLDNADEETVIATIESLNDTYSVFGTSVIVSTLNTIVNFITIALAGFSGIALIAASFGIINTQLMSVFERTKEIGLLKALGMSNKAVQRLFSYEAISIGVIGASVGTALAYGVQVFVNTYFKDGLKDFGGAAILISIQDVVTVILGLALLAWLSGVIPARKAQQLDPIAR